jgi:hypothetical protein
MRRGLVAAGAVVGIVVGAVLTLAAGTVCVTGGTFGFCGLNFLVWNLRTPVALGLAGGLGGVLGGLLGLVIRRVAFRPGRSMR